MKNKNIIKFICPDCKEVVFWSEKDYLNKEEPICPYDGQKMILEDKFCPHCEILLKPKMIDVDGHNLEEHFICENCGFGMPALR